MILSGWHTSVQQQFEMLLQTHCFSTSISFFFSRVSPLPLCACWCIYHPFSLLSRPCIKSSIIAECFPQHWPSFIVTIKGLSRLLCGREKEREGVKGQERRVSSLHDTKRSRGVQSVSVRYLSLRARFEQWVFHWPALRFTLSRCRDLHPSPSVTSREALFYCGWNREQQIWVQPRFTRNAF